MKKLLLVLVVLIFSLLLPFTEGTPEKRFLEITSVTINFDKTDAIITVDYDLGRLPTLYVLLLGGKSLEPKIKNLFSNFDYEIIKIDQDKATFRVKDFMRLDKGYYLHDSRIKFGETIKSVLVYTPDSSRPREYSNLDETPNIFYRA